MNVADQIVSFGFSSIDLRNKASLGVALGIILASGKGENKIIKCD